MAGRLEVKITDRHKQLTEFNGDWKLEQRFFAGPGAEPVTNYGKTHARVMLGGRAVFMESELETGYSAIVVSTWNVAKGRYEGYFMDIYSLDGFDPLHGVTASRLPIREDSKFDLSDRGVFSGGATRERIWSSRLTTARVGSFVEGAPTQLLGVDTVPVEIVEHRINDDLWVLNCISFDATLAPYVQMENTYSR